MNEFLYISEDNPIKELNFKGYIRGFQYPKKTKSYNFYIKLLIETEHNEHIIINCFKSKKTNLYSPRNNDIDIRNIAPNQLIQFSLIKTKSNHYNLDTVQLIS